MENVTLLERVNRVAKRCELQYFELMENKDWEYSAAENGVLYGQLSTVDLLPIIRVSCIIGCSAEDTIKFLLENKNKQDWNESLIESREVVKLDENTRVLHETYIVPWPFSDREFVFFTKKIETSSGTLIVARSIEAGVREKKDIVRGEIILSGFLVKKLDDHNVQLTYILVPDTKGNIPTSIKHLAGKKQSAYLNKLREVLLARR